MKIKKQIKITLIFIMLILFPILAFAEEEFVLPQYTEEYKQWLALPEEEKQKCMEPQAYETIDDSSENVTFSEDRNLNASASNLPSSYQRNDYGSVKDQGGSNACWAYSAATMFDTNYAVTNQATRKIFSNLHMDYMTSYQYNQNGFNRRVDSGGNIQIALAYATNGMGIALESEMPFKIDATTMASVPIQAKVNDYIELSGQSQMKDYLYRYGVISAFTYSGGSAFYSVSSASDLFNNPNLAYCCDQNITANHAVTLVGWNDNYTNASFPNKKGAYLALNSYGANFGNNGLYYIFYDDIFVNSKTYAATNTSDIKYDYLYQHDPYGSTAHAGYTTGTYAANVFTKKDTKYTETITEISSYFPTAGEITIYINANGADVKTSSATKTVKTTITKPGYHTIQLKEAVQVKGEKFAVGIRYPDYMSVELPTPSGWCSTITSSLGESYISKDGEHYFDAQQAYTQYKYANACIKAFTKKGEPIKTEPPKENLPVSGYHDDLINYVFDSQYYADHNPDLYIAYGYNESALRNHWNTYGIAEGRPASPVWDPNYYVSQNLDLAKAFGRDYIALYNHFMNYGYAEYRKSSLEYDARYYRSHNNDLKNMSSMELIRHYSIFGKNELRRASQKYDITRYLFDPQVYATCNPDVRNAFGNNEYLLKKHWYEFGIREGRIASFLFDARYYLRNNKDLVNAFSQTNYTAAYYHFIEYGFTEQRQGNALFSTTYYLAQNTDLRKAFGENCLKGVNHFYHFGRRERRRTAQRFNVIAYRSKNKDLQNAFGGNYEQYWMHYLQYGQYENRICL